MSNFDLDAIDPLTGLRGAVVFAGQGPGRIGGRTFVPTQKTNFGPRIGFAYSPDGKTSVRGAATTALVRSTRTICDWRRVSPTTI